MRRNVHSSSHLTIDRRNKCTIVLNLDLFLLGGCVDGVSAALGSLLSISGAGDGGLGHIGWPGFPCLWIFGSMQGVVTFGSARGNDTFLGYLRGIATIAGRY